MAADHDVFGNCDIPEDEELRERIAGQIECPHCRAPLDINVYRGRRLASGPVAE